MKNKMLYAVFFLFAFGMGMAASMGGGDESFASTMVEAPELSMSRRVVPTANGMTLVIKIPQGETAR